MGSDHVPSALLLWQAGRMEEAAEVLKRALANPVDSVVRQRRRQVLRRGPMSISPGILVVMEPVEGRDVRIRIEPFHLIPERGDVQSVMTLFPPGEGSRGSWTNASGCRLRGHFC